MAQTDQRQQQQLSRQHNKTMARAAVSAVAQQLAAFNHCR